MPIRTFTLNSPEAYEALCEPRERPWIPNGSLPREPRWPDRSGPLWMSGEGGHDADEAAREWLWHLENGRIGGDR
jgi:hypothetical protein